MRARAAICVLALAATAACATSPDAGSLRPPPERFGAAPTEELAGGGWSIADPDEAWGIGHLSSPAGLDDLLIPLFDAPGGDHWGWLARQGVYDLDTRRNLADSARARIDLGGGAEGYAALEEGAGGWVRLRWGDPSSARGGTAWTQARLARGARARVTPWRDHFRDADGLIYRSAGTAHNLRAGPGPGHEVLMTMAGRDFDLEAFEIRGDWMQVGFSRPPACASGRGRRADELGLMGGPAGAEAARATMTGWIRWRSPAKGPWLDAAIQRDCAGAAS